MTTPLNPYVAGNPVGDSPAFVGRADVLREVLRVLRRSQDNAILLYGQRRIGKTSILQHLAAWLPREGTYRPVYFDLQDKAAWPLGRVLQELARSIVHNLKLPDPDLSPDPETTFRQEWLPAVLANLPKGSSLALLFDEFDVLADPKAEQAATAFFPYLRDLLTLDPRRLQFAFVIGRNVADLTSIALSLFKGIPYQRVSLLSREDTTNLVRLSEKNGTLTWSDETVERVWQLTHGHPFLTQQLCSHVWERAYDEKPDEPPTVAPADVDAAVPDALEASRNTLEWLWDGLPPAERVVASALAEAGPGPITQDELESLLHESGVRVVIRELKNAPQLLQEWDLIEPADSGYRFRVELLRRWIVAHKPLRRVQEELDHIEPTAENLYQAALGLYRGEQLGQAIEPLRQAISLNPNHVRANQLLADILLAQGQASEARQLLERLYAYQPAAARPRLVQALLAQAQVAENDDARLALYKQVLDLDPTQSEATAKVAEIEQEMRRRGLAARLQQLEGLEQEGAYQDALDLVRWLVDEYGDMRDWTSDMKRLEHKTRLAGLYQRALGALQSDDRRTAQTLLAQLVALDPEYPGATRYLHLAVTGVDVAKLQNQLEAERKARQEAEIAAKEAMPLKEAYLQREQELQQLQTQLDAERKAHQQTKSNAKKKNRRPRKQAQKWQTEDYVETFSKWLASTLIWLPLSIPTLALGLGCLPRTKYALPSTNYLWISLGLVIACVLTNWLGKYGKHDALWVFVITFAVTFVVAFVVAFGMAFDVAFGVAFGLALIVTLSVAANIAGDMVSLVAGSMIVGAVCGMAGGMIVNTWGSTVIGIAVGIVIGVAGVAAFISASIGVHWMINNSIVGVTAVSMAVVVAGIIGGIIAVVMTLIVVGVVAFVVEVLMTAIAKTLGQTEPPFWLVRGAFGALALAHAFLVWFSFLGGWRVFQ